MNVPSVKSSTQSVEVPFEILNEIFVYLSKDDLLTCSLVSQLWKIVAEQDSFWKRCLGKKDQSWQEKTGVKKFYIDQEKSKFIASFPKALLQAFGGLEKTKELPYIHLQGVRSLDHGSIKLNEMRAPMTLGRVSATSGKVAAVAQGGIAMYSFFAVRFIDREFDPDDETKQLNVWLTKGSLCTDTGRWIMLAGSREDAWPTWFCRENGTGLDFSRTIEYVGRLLRGEPCGIRDACSAVEHSKITRNGKNTVSLA